MNTFSTIIETAAKRARETVRGLADGPVGDVMRRAIGTFSSGSGGKTGEKKRRTKSEDLSPLESHMSDSDISLVTGSDQSQDSNTPSSQSHSQPSSPMPAAVAPSANFIHKITPRTSVKHEAEAAGQAGRIYLDYASLSPMDPRVKKVMVDAIDEYQANPSSLYKEGVKAKKALHDARVSVGQFFGVQPDEIIFTSGGTESNNLAFQGVLAGCGDMMRASQADSGQGMPHGIGRPHCIISTIEHPSIVEIALDLTNRGYDISFVPVNADGIVDPKDVRKALRPETVLVSIMYANNEIGTIQPVRDIAREVRHYKKGLGRSSSEYPYMHTDACQAVLYEDMRMPTLGVDLMTIDGGKVYGPRGMGILVKRRHVTLSPVFRGGSQEFGLRAGTENLPAILGLKHALDIAHSEREEAVVKMGRFQETMLDLLLARLTDFVPNVTLNGHRSDRLPNNLNICFPGMDAEFLVLRLDALGVALSSVTSCRANDEDSSSYVIEALGKDSCAQSSLRITFGRFTTSAEVALAIEKIVQAVKEQVKG